MTRAILAFCAGAGLMMFLVGCDSVTWFIKGDFPNGDPSSDGSVVVGKLDDVALSAQAKLQGLGLKVNMTREGEAVHLASATRSGAAFKLVMTREMTAQGEQTRIKLQWGNGYDRAAAVQILSEVAPKATR